MGNSQKCYNSYSLRELKQIKQPKVIIITFNYFEWRLTYI